MKMIHLKQKMVKPQQWYTWDTTNHCRILFWRPEWPSWLHLKIDIIKSFTFILYCLKEVIWSVGQSIADKMSDCNFSIRFKCRLIFLFSCAHALRHSSVVSMLQCDMVDVAGLEINSGASVSAPVTTNNQKNTLTELSDLFGGMASPAPAVCTHVP